MRSMVEGANGEATLLAPSTALRAVSLPRVAGKDVDRDSERGKSAFRPSPRDRATGLLPTLPASREAHQNSMPGCAFTPAAKWCFTTVISVTRSAAAISSALALRPVTTTCSPGRRACSAAITACSGR